jgi:hypothetical protein
MKEKILNAENTFTKEIKNNTKDEIASESAMDLL